MSVDGIYNIPKAVYCIGVTNTVIGHNVLCWATNKPINGTSKSDIWGNWSIWFVSCSTFLTRCLGDERTKLDCQTLESSIIHLMCSSEVHFSKLFINVLNRPSFASSKCPSRDRSMIRRAQHRLIATSTITAATFKTMFATDDKFSESFAYNSPRLVWVLALIIVVKLSLIPWKMNPRPQEIGA
jgi:hypothetical protein